MNDQLERQSGASKEARYEDVALELDDLRDGLRHTISALEREREACERWMQRVGELESVLHEVVRHYSPGSFINTLAQCALANGKKMETPNGPV